LGQQELITRIQTGHSSTYSELFIDTRRTTVQSGDDIATSKLVSTKNNSTTKSTRANNKRQDAVESSNDGVSKTTRGKRKNTELDDAIQKQRDFLNGFVSK
jgi:hypothetical protein